MSAIQLKPVVSAASMTDVARYFPEYLTAPQPPGSPGYDFMQQTGGFSNARITHTPTSCTVRGSLEGVPYVLEIAYHKAGTGTEIAAAISFSGWLAGIAEGQLNSNIGKVNAGVASWIGGLPAFIARQKQLPSGPALA